MRRLRRAALLAVSIVTITACLPKRDNGSDPSNRPTGVLSISSSGFIPYGAEGDDQDADGCVDTADSLSSILPRAKCLHLSATGSSDPQGDATLKTFAFALVSTSASETAPLLPEHVIVSTVGTSSSVVLRASALRQQLPGSYLARLEVTDRDGNSHVTLSSVTLENSRPLAVPPSPRFVTNWGAAWSTNGTPDYSVLRPITVHFTADGSFDPDGDPLVYCWYDRTNDRDLGCRTDPEIAVAPMPTTSSGKLVLELRVNDVLEFSQPVLATAVLDSSPGWAFENDTASVKVLDDRRVSFILDGMDTGTVKFDGALEIDVNPGNLQDSVLYYKSRQDDRTIARRTIGKMCAGCSMDPLQSVSLDPSVVRVSNVVHARAFPFVWVIAVTAAGTMQVEARNAANLALLDFASSGQTFFSDGGAFGKVDRSGRLWAGSPFTDEGVTCFQFSPTPSPAITECGFIPVDDGYLLTGLALRDVAGAPGQEVWVMQSRNFLTGAGGSPFASVLTVDAQGTEVIVRVPVNTDELSFDADLAFTLEFVDSNLSWLNLFGEGIASVELCNPNPAGLNPGSGRVASPTALCVRTIAPFEATFDVVSDPATGTFVGLGLEGHSLNRMTLGGQPSRVESPERFETLLHVDLASGVWAVIENGNGSYVLTRGRGSGLDGQIIGAPVGTSFSPPVMDYASGDIWVASIFPPGAARYSPDGSRTDLVTGIVKRNLDGDLVGAAVPLILPGQVVPDPHRGRAWIINDVIPGNVNGGNSLALFEPYARRAPTSPTIARGVRGLDVFVVGSAQMAATGESVVDSAVHVQSGDLIVLTISSTAQAGCGPVTGQALNYFLRRVKAIDGGGWAAATPVCVVENYLQANGGSPVRFARDLSSGDVCVGYSQGGLAKMSRFRGENLSLEASGELTGNNTADLAADPQKCWMVGGNNEFGGAVFVLGTSGIGTLEPGPFPFVSTIRPVVGLSEVREQKMATRVWLGGGEGDPIVLYNVNSALLATPNREALPLSSAFEMEFVKH